MEIPRDLSKVDKRKLYKADRPHDVLDELLKLKKYKKSVRIPFTFMRGDNPDKPQAYVKSLKEIEGIRKAKVKKRQERKKAQMETFHNSDRDRKKKIREKRERKNKFPTLPNMAFKDYQDGERKRINLILKAQRAKRKEENTEKKYQALVLRKANNAKKAERKQRKKENRDKRKALKKVTFQTESESEQLCFIDMESKDCEPTQESIYIPWSEEIIDSVSEDGSTTTKDCVENIAEDVDVTSIEENYVYNDKYIMPGQIKYRAYPMKSYSPHYLSSHFKIKLNMMHYSLFKADPCVTFLRSTVRHLTADKPIVEEEFMMMVLRQITKLNVQKYLTSKYSIDVKDVLNYFRFICAEKLPEEHMDIPYMPKAICAQGDKKSLKYDYENFLFSLGDPSNYKVDIDTSLMFKHDYWKNTIEARRLIEQCGYIFDVVILMDSIYNARDFKETFKAIYHFMGSMGVDSVFEKIYKSTFHASWVSLLTYLFEQFVDNKEEQKEDVFVAESFIETLQSGVNIFEKIVDSHIVTIIKTVVIMGISLASMGKLFPVSYLKYFNMKEKDISLGALLMSIVELIKFAVNMMTLWMNGMPLYDCFTNARPGEYIVENASRLLRQKDRLYTGLPTPGMMSQRIFLEEAVQYEKVFADMLKNMSSLNPNYRIYSSLQDQLSSAICDIRVLSRSKDRITPFAVIIEGPPGIGKSGVFRLICMIMSDLLGWEFEYDQVYTRVNTSPYFEAYNPESHPIIRYSELADDTEAMAQKKGDAMIDELTSLIDSLPWPVNMAFADKGKVFAKPMMVVIDTNNPELNLRVLKSNPAAVRRRFVYIKPSVKEEFATAEGTLDARKTVGARPMSYWNYEVYRQIPLNVKDSRKVVLMDPAEEATIESFARVMKDQMRNHYENEEIALQNKKTRVDMEEMKAEGLVDYCLHGTLLACSRDYRRLIWHNFQYAMGLALRENIEELILITISIVCFLQSGSLSLLMLLAIAWVIAYKMRKPTTPEVYRNNQGILISRKLEDFKSIAIKAGIAITGLGALSYGVYAFTNQSKKKKHMSPEASIFHVEDEMNSKINELEHEVDAGRSYQRIGNKVDAQIWNTKINSSNGKYTGDIAGLNQLLDKNVCKVRVVSKDFSIRTHLFGVCSNYAVINRHCATIQDNVEIQMFDRTGTTVISTSYLRDKDMVTICEDLMLVSLSSKVFKDIRKHIIPDDKLPSIAHGQLVGFNEMLTVNLVEEDIDIEDKHNNILLNRYLSYGWNNHRRGQCGLPLIVDVGRTRAVVGIHTAGSVESAMCVSSIFTLEALESAITTIKKNQDLMILHSEGSFHVHIEGEVPRKSMTRYEDLRTVDYYGSTGAPVLANGVSKLVRTRIASELDMFFVENLDHIVQKKVGKPKLGPHRIDKQYINPYNIAASNMARPKKSLNRKILFKAVKIVHEHIIENIGDLKLSPLDLETALNGDSDDIYLRAMNFSTGSGFGNDGPKSKHFPIVHETKSEVTREPTSRLKKLISMAMMCYKKGETFKFINVGCLKDEPRPRLKPARLFNVSPAELVAISRMFLAPIFTLIVEKGMVFGAALGTNMHRAGNRLVEYLVFKLLMEGDYSKFDQVMPGDIGWGVSTLITMLAKSLGYNDFALNVLRGILTENLHVVLCILEEIFVFFGVQVSGKYGTAEDNSLRGLLLLVYAWLVLTGVEDFFKYNRPLIYGDDFLNAVHEDYADVFNNFTYQEFCDKFYGMKMTPATKDGKMQKFLDITEVSFLKRTFVFREDLKVYTCPLHKDSLYKMLEWKLPGKCSELEHITSIVTSFLFELFQHYPCAHFTRVRSALIKLIEDKYECENFNVVDHNDIHAIVLDRSCETCFITKYKETKKPLYVVEAREELIMVGTRKINTIKTHTGDVNMSQLTLLNQWLSENKENFYYKMIKEQEDIISALQENPVPNPIPDLRAHELRKIGTYHTSNAFKKQVDKYGDYEGKLLEAKSTVRHLRRFMRKQGMHTEAEVEENMLITDTKSDDVSAGTTHYDEQGAQGLLSMDDFISRPTMMLRTSITNGADFFTTIKPFSIILNEPLVRRKLSNYAYIKANIKLAIQISGTKFHSGRVLFSYQPFAGYNTSLVNADIFARDIYLSQSEGAVTCNVNENTTIHMSIPYISPAPMMRLYNTASTAVSPSTEFEDAASLGELFISTIVPVTSVSSTPTNTFLTIYGWLEDVECGCPTATVITEGDERKIGPIENLASSAAEIMDKAKTIPIIGPYAQASQKPLENLRDASALFGFSAPTNTNYASPVYQQPFSNSANLVRMDSGYKMSMDPKQEISIDSRVTGGKEDQMSISHICARQSLLTNFAWDTSDIPLTNVIFETPVHPMMEYTYSVGLGRQYVPTPVSYAAKPFKFWRGDVTYTLDCVASTYHTGKLAIYYEPNISQGSLTTTDLDLNRQYIATIDLADSHTIQFTVKWASRRAWNKNISSDLRQLGAGLGPDYQDAANGCFFITPLTRLQSPDGSGIRVLLYVHSDNMRFAMPTEEYLPRSKFAFEGLVETDNTIDINKSTATERNIAKECFGEIPLSFRPLLKRYNVAYQGNVSPNGNNLIKIISDVNILPQSHPLFGEEDVDTDLFSYMRYAYVGLKGSMKFRFVLDTSDYVGEMGGTTMSLLNAEDAYMVDAVTINGNPNSMSLNGTIMYVPHTTGAVECEIPLYTNNLFLMSFDNHQQIMPPQFEVEYFRRFRTVVMVKGPVEKSRVNFYSCVGDDFSFLRFQGAPPYYVAD